MPRIQPLYCPLKQTIPPLCLFLVLIMTQLASAEPVPRKIFKIGVIAGTTGLAADAGVSVRRGVELADQTFDNDNTVEFIFEDDALQPKNAVSAAEKLITQNRVDALITFTGPISLAVAPLAERRSVPMIGITLLTKVSEGKRFVWTMFLPNHATIPLYTRAIRLQDSPRIAFVTTIQDSLLQLRDDLRKEGRSHVVFDQELLPGDTEVRSVITKLMASRPDVVVCSTLAPHSSLVAKALQERGFRGTLVGGPPMYNHSEIAAARGALTGAIVAGPKIRENDVYFGRYQATYHSPSLFEGMYAFDAATLLIRGAEAGDIASFIDRSTHFDGVAGSYPKSAAQQFEVPGELRIITAGGATRSALSPSG